MRSILNLCEEMRVVVWESFGWGEECYGLEGMEPSDVVDICEVDLCVVYSYHALL